MYNVKLPNLSFTGTNKDHLISRSITENETLWSCSNNIAEDVCVIRCHKWLKSTLSLLGVNNMNFVLLKLI